MPFARAGVAAAVLSSIAVALVTSCSWSVKGDSDDAGPPVGGGGGDDAAVPPDDAAPPPPPRDLAAAVDVATPVDLSPAPDLLPDPAIEEMHVRADRALQTLLLSYWPTLRANTTVFDWSYAHYWDALLDAGERRGKNAFAGSVRMFYDLQAQRGWFDDYYDDENWITLALIHSYDVSGDPMYLERAKDVFADIMKGWDETCCGAHPGGIFWHKPRDAKVTAINAGAVISAARLYQRTHDQLYLDFAKKTFAYWSTWMFDPATGHVYDGVSTAGVVNTTWAFTYNEGLFIGAVLAYRDVTGDQSVLAMAHKAAGYIMTKEMETTALGTILSDGHCSGDGQMFKGVGARYLGQLYAADPTHGEYREFLRRSALAAWTLARDPASGNISCDWKGPYEAATGNVASLGSAAVGIAAAAKALGAGVQRPAGQYEAEEGNLHGIGLEASHGDFSGWGYVAGWGGDGQSLDLVIDAPAGAGQYDLELRYATGDDARRALSVGATQVAASFAFPSTGGYDSYGTVHATVTLAAGRNTLTLLFSAAAGSRGWLNLDRARFTKK
jgi:predicted alpha-1,6-mannanase (GH76 family)